MAGFCPTADNSSDIVVLRLCNKVYLSRYFSNAFLSALRRILASSWIDDRHVCGCTVVNAFNATSSSRLKLWTGDFSVVRASQLRHQKVGIDKTRD